ncbi:MAG: NADH-quinone oxidoreductase subunit N, partial [Pyrinomonadaceae bacterium]
RLDTVFSVPLLLAGAAMLFIGFGFKIATAPFHVWTPDVYEGAPTPVTAFMTAGPKAAGFASFLRVFVFGFPFVTAGGFDSALSTPASKVHAAWIGAMVLVAVLTMTIGNLVAIVQSNVKRLLAYSSIAHAGYALLGFIAAGASDDIAKRDAAVNSVIFYLLAYSIMNLGAFAIVTLLAQSNDRRNMVEDYTGIGFRAPLLSLALSLFLLSLFGMPLTAGFMGKIFVFRAAYDAGYTGLIVIAVLNTALSAYYYLRLIIVMFFRERQTEWIAPRVPASITIVLVLTILGVFYLGLFPGRLVNALQTVRESINARNTTVMIKE